MDFTHKKKSCCVLACLNNRNSGQPKEDVSFYSIPKEYHMRQLWTEAIGIPEWQLGPKSGVCSLHFRDYDFTMSETGERILVDGSVPSLCLNTPKDLQAVADFKTCRACLGMNRRMYHIRDYNLHYVYEMIVGIMVTAVDRLPQMLCWECTGRLMSFRSFKEKAQKSQLLLLDKLAVSDILTVGDIKSINRINYNLKSHFTLKHSEPNEFDLHIDHDEGAFREVKIESNKIKSEPTGVGETIQLKHEDSDVKDEMNHSDDSDDLDLSERIRQARKRKAEKVTNRKRLKKVVKEKKSDAVGKFQRTTKRRVVAKPELPTFDIRQLSLDEQMAELMARGRSAAYVNAPHKCEACYRGFRSADTLALHALRHTEKCGKFECAVCKRRFRLARDVRHHAARNHHHQYSCKACSFVTQCRRTATDHQKWHAGNTYTCPHCPTVLTKFTSYMSHLRVKHSSRFSCELCGYTFVSERGVQVHKAKCHLLETQVKLDGPYCEECKLRFANDDAYQRHLTQSSVHSSDNNPKRVRNEKSYPTHSAKRRGPGTLRPDRAEPPKQNIPCEQCGEQQESYKAYAKHFRAAHPGLIRTKFPRATGNCMCEQCGRMFATKTLLLDHRATHSGEKRFKCDACDKAFTNKKNLSAHRSVHGVQVSTYRCPYCEREFLHYQNCSRHVKTVHKGVKQFQCEICGKEFTSAAGQRAHVDHVHHKKPRPKRVRARAPPTAYRDW